MSTAASITMDGQGWFKAVSPAFLGLIGRPVEALAGVKLVDLIHPLDAGTVRQLASQATEGQPAPAVPVRIFGPGDAWLAVDCRMQLAEPDRITVELTVAELPARAESDPGDREPPPGEAAESDPGDREPPRGEAAESDPSDPGQTRLVVAPGASPDAGGDPFMAGSHPGPDTPDRRVAIRASLGDESTPMIEIDADGRTVYVSGPWPTLSQTGAVGTAVFKELIRESGQAPQVMDGIQGTLHQASSHRFVLPATAAGSLSRWLHVVPIPSPHQAGVVHALVAVVQDPTHLAPTDLAPTVAAPTDLAPSSQDSPEPSAVDASPDLVKFLGDAPETKAETETETDEHDGANGEGAAAETREATDSGTEHANADVLDDQHSQQLAPEEQDVAEKQPGFDFGSVGPFTWVAAIATVAIAAQAILTSNVSGGTFLLVAVVGAFGAWCGHSDGPKPMQAAIGLAAASLLALLLLGSQSPGSESTADVSSGPADTGLGERAEQGPLEVEIVSPDSVTIGEDQTYRALGIVGFANTHAIATSGDGAIVSSADGRLAVLDVTGAVTMVVGLGGYESSFVTDIAVDAEGLIWALDAGAGRLYRVDTQGTVTDVPADPGFLTNARGIGLGSNSTLWIASTASAQLTQFSADGELAAVVPLPDRQASDVFEAADGTLWFVDAQDFELVHVGLTGEVLNTLPLEGFTSLESPHIAQQGNLLWLTEPEFSGVIGVDTSAVEVVERIDITRPAGEPVLKPIGIAVGADGRLWIVDSMAGAVLIIDTAS